jgi:hypothetical protein
LISQVQQIGATLVGGLIPLQTFGLTVFDREFNPAVVAFFKAGLPAR